jgi:trimethylamine:corrinoid methyltransferase-like protein
LEHYEPPPLDPAIAEALDDFVARRKETLKDLDH